MGKIPKCQACEKECSTTRYSRLWQMLVCDTCHLDQLAYVDPRSYEAVMESRKKWQD